MSWNSNLLVFASRTVESEELRRELGARSRAGSIHVTLVAPSDTGRVPTAVRLERAVDRLEADGISVEGIVGDRDPLVALEEVWDPHRFDEVIVATLPTDVSRWMALDVPQRIERVTGSRVTRVVASATAPAPEVAGRTPRAHA